MRFSSIIQCKFFFVRNKKILIFSLLIYRKSSDLKSNKYHTKMYPNEARSQYESAVADLQYFHSSPDAESRLGSLVVELCAHFHDSCRKRMATVNDMIFPVDDTSSIPSLMFYLITNSVATE